MIINCNKIRLGSLWGRNVWGVRFVLVGGPARLSKDLKALNLTEFSVENSRTKCRLILQLKLRDLLPLKRFLIGICLYCARSWSIKMKNYRVWWPPSVWRRWQRYDDDEHQWCSDDHFLPSKGLGYIFSTLGWIFTAWSSKMRLKGLRLPTMSFKIPTKW